VRARRGSTPSEASLRSRTGRASPRPLFRRLQAVATLHPQARAVGRRTHPCRPRSGRGSRPHVRGAASHRGAPVARPGARRGLLGASTWLALPPPAVAGASRGRATTEIAQARRPRVRFRCVGHGRRVPPLATRCRVGRDAKVAISTKARRSRPYSTPTSGQRPLGFKA
jgi:hypothetical protein